MAKKKKKTADFILNPNGSITVNKDRTTEEADLVVNNGTVTVNRNKTIGRSLNDDIAPVKVTTRVAEAEREYKEALASGASDVMVQTKLNALNQAKKDEKDGRKWFREAEGSTFDKILGTGTKFAEKGTEAILGMGEAAVDAFAWLAPIYNAGQTVQNGGNFDIDTYRKQQEYSKDFIKKDLYSEENIARKIITEPAKKIGIDADKSSILGERSEDLIKSAGQLGATFAMQAGGIPWFLTTGVTSFGSETENAFEQGASYEEAGASALITAGADILTEKLSGGIKFGGKAADEVVVRRLGEAISNKTYRTLAKIGTDMTGEGFEEVIASMASNLGTTLYKDESALELLTSEEAMDEYIESFVGGAVLGGVISGGSAVKNKKTGRDYVTGLTEGEQSVIDTIVNERTTTKQKQVATTKKNQMLEDAIKSELEKETGIQGNLTDNQKKIIEDRVKNEIEDIDYTTIKLSKKELNEIKRQVREELDRGEIDTFTIENTLYGDSIQKMRELGNKLQTADEAGKAEIQAEIDKLQAGYDDVLNKNELLKESYVQRELGKQEFDRKLTGKETEKEKAIIENVKRLKIGNNRKAHEMVDFAIKVSNESDYNVIFTNNEELENSGRYDDEISAEIRAKKLELKNELDKQKKSAIGREIDQLRAKRGTIDGFIVKSNGNIVINIDSPRALNTIVGHELTHAIEKSKFYQAYKGFIEEYSKSKGVYDKYKADAEKLYKDRDANVDEEVVAFLTGDYIFTDQTFIDKLSAEQPSIFRQAYDYIKHVYKLATAGSKEARQLEQAKRMFEKAWKQANKTTTGKVDSNLTTEADSDTENIQFSLSNKNITKDTKIPYVENQNYINVPKNDNVTLEKLRNEVRNLKRGAYENKATGYKADIKRETIGKIITPKPGKFNPWVGNYIENLNAAVKLPELFEKAVYIDSKPPQKAKNAGKQIKDFHHFVAPIRMNGEDYRVMITAREKQNSDTLYIVKTELMQIKRGSQTGGQKPTVSFGNPLDISIPDLVNGVNIYDYDTQKNVTYSEADLKYSLSDSQGRELTKEQQEYFKDSKVVDEEGNLRVVYHGSNEDFTIFDRTKARANMDIQGNFFSPWDLDAQGYGENVRAFYLNITNPAPEGIAYKALNKFKGQNGAGIKAREYLESLGYDGVNNGDEEYIAFYPNQIKSIDNENPTDNPDINLSLSDPSEDRIPVKGYAVYGSDIKLQEDIAPVKETISEAETVAEDIAPVKAVVEEDDELSKPLTEADLPYFEQERDEAFASLPDDYAPIAEEYYNEPDTAPLDDKFLRLVGKNMRQELGLKNNQVAGLRKIIQDFSTSEDQNMESLHDAIEREFGTIYEKQKIDDVTGIKAALRSTRIKVSDLIKTDIPDYSKWRQKQFGTLRIANDGMDVDVVYEELKEIYPQYFPEDITNPTDQLLKIAEVASMDATYIEEYSLPEENIQEVADYIYESVSEYKQQKRFEAAQTASKAPIDESMIPYKETILETSIPEDAAPVKKEVEPEAEPETVVEKTKRELRKHLIEDDAGFLAKALDKAKNIPMAMMNNTDTIRVTEMVFGRRAGKKINELIFQKAIDNEARSIAWQNKQRAEIAALGIKARSKESEAVQKYAEKKILTDEGEYITYDDAALARDFPNPDDRAKIIRAARALREKYDTYIDVANNVLTNLGFDAIPKRDDYMRHFQELNDVFTRYGIPFNAQNMSEHTLPTDINGLTEFWSPQKNFFANIRPREGMRTTFDAITGIDGYISGIANLIYHTEDIQRGRALEDLVRDTYGENTGWDNLEKLPEEEQAARAELIQDNHLSNYAAWLHEWTNNIAGKKNKIDRSIESMFGRRAFSFLDETRKQVGSNMIGLNLSSSLTNLIAPVQAMAKTNKLAVAKGTADTIKNIFVKDKFMENNSFLTSRMGTDRLSKTAWEKMRDAGYIFMKGMDWFSSNQIVRSKFYELKAQGLTDIEAHAEAGKFAARVMGDRTKGANAQLYNSKLVGLVTQFQLEVNNQLYSMFYDTYHESKESAHNNALKTAAGMTFTLGQLFAFTHLFGKTFESIAGYNPTFDVIGILATALGSGDDEEDKPVSERLKDAADKLVDALPYVNILTGGGRIPVTSGIPNLVGVATGGKDDYGNELTWKGELEKLIYLVPPTGGGQIKKTTQGLEMFDSDNPVTGSYTDSGNLRFPVEDTPLNVLQAGVFGQWSSKNARNYFDNERKPLGEKQIQEYKDLDLPIADYWKYREGLKGKKTLEDKFDYIADLDLPVSKKNIMINNIVDRKETVDMSNYDQFGTYEEFDWATKNPEKYSYFESIGVSYKQYSASDESKEAYNWAYKNPEKYSLARAAAGDVVTYRSYVSSLNDITADKDSNGKSISGSRKTKVASYINSLDADYGTKLILFKSEYPSDNTYNYEIIEYLNNREDISYQEMASILTELGFTVDANGNVRW